VKLKTSPDNADGNLLSNEEYGRQRSELLKEKAALEELLRDAGHRVEQWLKHSEQTFEFACTARDRFAVGNSKAKKEILAAVGSNLILNDQKLCIKATEPFLILEKSLSGQEHENETIEPEKTEAGQGQEVTNDSQSLRLLGGLDDSRTLHHANVRLVKSVYDFFRYRSIEEISPYIWN
jgi:hypothetical protein